MTGLLSRFGGVWLLALRLALVVVLVWGATQLLKRTRHEIVVDASLPRIRENERWNPLSRAREVRIRQVLALDPGNADAVEILARHLVDREKRKFAEGHLSLIEEESLLECLRYLERRRRVYASVPETTRLQAEIHQLLAEVYRRQGEAELATGQADEASRFYRRAIRELPEPRVLRDEYYVGGILAASFAGDAPELIDIVQRMDRDWRRYAIHEWDLINDYVSRAYFELGMHGHQVREMRYALVWESWNPRVIPGLRIAAQSLGEEVAVRHTLRSVKPRNHPERDEERLGLLAELEELNNISVKGSFR
jgi:tetratricopeptide (TPR) repeat protein